MNIEDAFHRPLLLDAGTLVEEAQVIDTYTSWSDHQPSQIRLLPIFPQVDAALSQLVSFSLDFNGQVDLEDPLDPFWY